MTDTQNHTRFEQTGKPRRNLLTCSKINRATIDKLSGHRPLGSKLTRYFANQIGAVPNKRHFTHILDFATRTDIGERLLQNFANNNGTMEAVDKIPGSNARAQYKHRANLNKIILTTHSTSTDVLHESDHARQQTKTRNIAIPVQTALSSNAHLSVLKEASSWAISALYWKEFFAFNPGKVQEFIKMEEKLFEHMTDIFPPDETFLKASRSVIDTGYDLAPQQILLIFATNGLSRIKNGESPREVEAKNIVNILSPETDLQWMSNFFNAYVQGGEIKKCNGYFYTERVLKMPNPNHPKTLNYIRLCCEDMGGGTSPEHIEHYRRKIFPPIPKNIFKSIIEKFSDLNDLGMEGNYTDPCLINGKLPVHFLRPGRNLQRRAEKVERRLIEQALALPPP